MRGDDLRPKAARGSERGELIRATERFAESLNPVFLKRVLQLRHERTFHPCLYVMPVPRGGRFVPAPMRYFVRFNNAAGMHAGYLPGYPASHGCVRLPEEKAIAIFNAVDVGTPVTVFGRTPRGREMGEVRLQRRTRAPAWPNDPRAFYPAPWWVR